MRNMINDLDNNLLLDQEFSGFDMYRTAATTSPAPKPLNPILIEGATEQSLVTASPKPKTSTSITPTLSGTTFTQPIYLTPEQGGISIPRPISPTVTETPTTPATEEEPISDMPIMGGGGGGTSNRQSGEEEPQEETQGEEISPASKKIIGLTPNMFYSLLSLLSIGGYFYFRNKSK